jgi:hypothetical protein
VANPIVNWAWLPKTLIDGSSSLTIIFTEMLRKMDFDFSKMTACDEPFYGVVPGKVAYPIGRVCLPVTFGREENFRTEYLTFEVADFRSPYHAIFGRPMLAKFMAIPDHTYLIMKMPAPNGILFVLVDVLLVALMPPRRRVSFLLGGAVSSSMLRGDSETECLLEDVVDNGLDDDDPFFFLKTCGFLSHDRSTLLSTKIPGFNW